MQKITTLLISVTYTNYDWTKKEKSFLKGFGPVTYSFHNRLEDVTNKKLTVEKRYCEKKLEFIKNKQNISINAGKTFVYKGEIRESKARLNFPGCLLSRCCEKKIRK